MNTCIKCLRPLIGRQSKYCTHCINADRNNNRSRRDKREEMFCSVDTEGVEIDGIMRTVSVSYGREDGTSDSLSAPDGEWLTGQETLEWLIDYLTGVYTDANGVQWKQALVAFHFGYDTAVIAKDFTEDLTLIYKATARNRNLLCNTAHTDDEECLRLHRYDKHLQQLIITEGGEGDVLTWHAPSQIAIATSAKRRFYAELRPLGDRMEGNRRLDIHDTGTAFTGGLLSVIDQWQPELSPEQHAAIEWGKASRRNSFDAADILQIEKYSEAECIAHARVCRKLLDAVRDAGHIPLKPSHLFGSGSIASAALDYYGVATRKLTMTCGHMVRGLEVDQLPTMTYFGGLIETPVLGQLDEPVDEADINSAYPSHMLSLPCMREGHGKWVSRPGASISTAPSGSLGYVLASWDVQTPSTPPFLVRTREGLVRQPLTGSKVWVSLPEYETAVAQFPDGVIAHHVVYYEQECECVNPLLFLADLYNKRADIKAAMGLLERPDKSHVTDPEWMLLNCQQLAIKLVINSIYGKFAQRRPALGRFTNMHYASHITGSTRAQVRRESWLRESQGGTVVYTHTDSVLSIGGTPVHGGSALGAWGLEKRSFGFTIVQPGLAVSIGGGKTASRGCGKNEFRVGVEAWLEIADLTRPPRTWPSIPIQRTFMLGRRLAIHEGHPELAGNFVRRDFNPGFTSQKRNLDAARTLPGNPRAWLIPPCPIVYADDIATFEDIRSFETELSRLIAAGAFDDDGV
jgi:hypothetical protein